MLAQTIFAFIYLTNQAVVMQLYITSHAVPPWALVLLCLSKRVKSIFLLRMFNDGVTTLLVNIALVLLIRRKWRWSLVVFSAALSVKMNVLLLVPPVVVVLLQVSKTRPGVVCLVADAVPITKASHAVICNLYISCFLLKFSMPIVP